MKIAKKEKRSKKNAVVAVVLIAALLITGALAFLTAQDSKTNVFTVGKVDLELWENFDSDNDGDPEEYGPETDTPPTFEDITPGKEVVKQPYMKNTGKNEAYVFMSVSVPTYDDDGTTKDLFTYTVNEGWKPLKIENGDGVNTYYYYMENPLSAEDGENVTPNLFDTVTFASVDNNFCNSLDDDAELNVVVNGFAVQVDGFASAIDAWNAAAEEFEEDVAHSITFMNDGEVVSHVPYIGPDDIVEMPYTKGVGDNGKVFNNNTTHKVSEFWDYGLNGTNPNNSHIDILNPDPIVNAIPETENKAKLIPLNINGTGDRIVVQRGETAETYFDYEGRDYPNGITSIIAPNNNFVESADNNNYFVFGFDYDGDAALARVTLRGTSEENEKVELAELKEKLANEYFTVTNGGYFEIEPRDPAYSYVAGNGMLITVYNSDGVIQETFRIITFADINGDFRVTSTDISIILNLMAFPEMFEKMPYMFNAADLDQNGVLNSKDYFFAQNIVAYMCVADQQTGVACNMDISGENWLSDKTPFECCLVKYEIGDACWNEDVWSTNGSHYFNEDAVRPGQSIDLSPTKNDEPILIDSGGYFAGWSLDGETILPSNYVVNSDVVLYPVFKTAVPS